MAEQILRTLMRTTDIIVAGYLSPATVAAVGLADLYGRLQLRVGLGFGDGAIALASQDTGSAATANRAEAISQALLIGVLVGIPLSLFGVVFSEPVIAVLGAEPTVVRQSSQYLALIFLVSPANHTTYIAARAIQGTGDTRTPMYVNGLANGLNIVGTVGLAFGIGPLPELSIVGIALATAGADVFTAVTFSLLIYSSRTDLSLAWPASFTVTYQLVRVSIPRVAEGVAELIAEFPFNAILLSFGTEVNAAYQIGRRMYQQIVSPLSRGYAVGAAVIVGQTIGRGDPDEAYVDGLAAAGLGFLTVGGLSLGLFGGAEWFVWVFTRDPATLNYAVNFARAYAVAGIFIAGAVTIDGSLRGGSEALAPFLSRTSGLFIFFLGVTYVFGIVLGYGVVAAYGAIIVYFAWRLLFITVVYARQNWLDRATGLMIDRGSVTECSDSSDD